MVHSPSLLDKHHLLVSFLVIEVEAGGVGMLDSAVLHFMLDVGDQLGYGVVGGAIYVVYRHCH